jgi:hypothetical protein
MVNDFMVVKLAWPVTNKNYLTPITLNTDTSNPSNNEVLTVIGFGTTSENGWGSTTLMEVNVNYIPQSICNDGDHYAGEIDATTMLCAGVGGGKDSCQVSTDLHVALDRVGL